MKEVDIGIAADIGTLSRLPKIVGSFSWVKDVTLTARVFGAEEALRVGFVSEVVGATREEGYKAGLEKCKSIAEKSPVAVWGTKEILNYSRDRPVEEGLRCVLLDLGCYDALLTIPTTDTRLFGTVQCYRQKI